MINSTKKKLLVATELVLTSFVIAFILFYFGGVVLFLAGILICVILIRTGIISQRQMGLRTDNLLKTLPIYLLLYVITVVGAYIVKISGVSFDKEIVEFRMMWLVFLSSVAQELYYRGYLPIRIKVFTQSKFKVALIISILFGMVHVLLMPIIGYNYNFGTAQKRAVKWGKKMIIAIGIKFESGEIILISRVLNEEGSDRRMDWIPEAIPNEVFGSLFFPGRYVGNLRFLGRPAVRDHAVGKFRISVGISSKDNKSDRDLAAQICSNIWVNS